MTSKNNNLYTKFLNNTSKTFEDIPNIVSANQNQVHVHACAFMLIWQYNVIGNIKIHLYLKFQRENIRNCESHWSFNCFPLFTYITRTRLHAWMWFHAYLTAAYCRQLLNTSTSQVWKRNIKNCESYSNFNRISKFTCITRPTCMHVQERIYTTCLCILRIIIPFIFVLFVNVTFLKLQGLLSWKI